MTCALCCVNPGVLRRASDRSLIIILGEDPGSSLLNPCNTILEHRSPLYLRLGRIRCRRINAPPKVHRLSMCDMLNLALATVGLTSTQCFSAPVAYAMQTKCTRAARKRPTYYFLAPFRVIASPFQASRNSHLEISKRINQIILLC